MHLKLDGVTPVPRMMLISEFLLHADFRAVLDRAVFVAAGDRLAHEDGDLAVTRPCGEQRRHPARDSHWICR
ncbi:hypothetical protein [Kitasatospora sp. NPDC007106]|uniref:hypothetical protein n=1 Tax=Kitasatospora sp. NPDC007106 TaxID=3156914 RepID=UPI0033E4324E